jgi:hypothetical protein
MLRTDKVRIRHILDASKEAVEFAKGHSRAELRERNWYSEEITWVRSNGVK